jgi:predicted RNase H-like HicB family nuclease
MKDSARYIKMVEWSEEDQCFVGSCPSLFYGGCHGSDEKQVFAELCDLVEEVIEIYKQDNKSLPPATSGKDFANRLLQLA